MKFYRRLMFFVLAISVLRMASAGAAIESERSADTEVEPRSKRESTTEHTASGTEAWNEVPLPVLMPLPLELLSLDKVCHVAYLDAFNILKDDNSCSRFFGGSASSVEVLNKLALQMQRKRLIDRGIGIRMSGRFTHVENMRTGFSYRLFDNALVNTNGPFYSRVPFGAASAQYQHVGRFPSYTRGARVLMLFHELGHLIQGSNGHWLIPDDFNNYKRILENTTAVEARCKKQLRSLD